jgi:DNA polymerase (family X)
MNCFVNYEEVKEVISHGSTRSSVKLRSGINVDLRVVPDESFGAALHYFTGSKPHNNAVRTLGVKHGLKVNEYGVFKGEKQIGGERSGKFTRRSACHTSSLNCARIAAKLMPRAKAVCRGL